MDGNIGTIVVVVILIAAVIGAVMSSLKHIRGEGGCCGGSSDIKVKRQRIKHVTAVKKISIEGMKCKNCVKRVENSLNSMSQVDAYVNLKKKEAIVNLGTIVPEELLKQAVEKEGYRVILISDMKP